MQHPLCLGQMRSRRRPARHAAATAPTALPLLAVTTALLAGPVIAHPDSTPRQEPARPGLEPQPLTVESLGLTMHPPAGSRIQVQKVGQSVTVTLVDGAEIPAWSMRIQVMASTLPDPSPAGQVEQLQQAWQAVGREYAVISNTPVSIAGRDGQLCYLRHSLDDGQAVVVGWQVLPFAEGSFLVFGMQILPDDFPRARAALESSFSTIQLRPVSEIAGQRKTRLDAGQAVLAALTTDRLRTLLGPGQWLRYYMPARIMGADSDRELGCMYVEFIEAKRGAISPTRPEENYDPADHRLGLMARVRGHIIDKPANATIDSQAFYWMAWDQSEERWSVQVTTRKGEKSSTDAQTGVRTPSSPSDPHGTITVIDSTAARTRDESAWHTPEVYLSQPLRWALGRLLPRHDPAERVFSYYCFDGATSTLSLRIDRWGPADDASDHRVLKSQPKSDTPAIVTIYDRDGCLLHRTWADGSVSEPITLEALHRLWKSKALSTEDLRR